MKLQSTILKMGTAFAGIQVVKDGKEVWGKFAGNDKVSDEQQQKMAEAILSRDGIVEIDYFQKEGKTGLNITSIMEVVDGKVVEPKIEAPKKVEEKKETKSEVSLPPASTAKKYKATNVPRSNDTQTSIENQVAVKAAAEVIKTLAGSITTVPELMKAYEALIDLSIKKIQG